MQGRADGANDDSHDAASSQSTLHTSTKPLPDVPPTFGTEYLDAVSAMLSYDDDTMSTPIPYGLLPSNQSTSNEQEILTKFTSEEHMIFNKLQETYKQAKQLGVAAEAIMQTSRRFEHTLFDKDLANRLMETSVVADCIVLEIEDHPLASRFKQAGRRLQSS
jgi:hypothetical protein